MNLYTLTNPNGMSMTVTDFGCVILTLNVPGADGKTRDVVVGFDKPEDYKQSNPYFGAVIGRVGNRIGYGKFTLDGRAYQLATNDNGLHHLHGGTEGFDKKIWHVDSVAADSITFSYTSPDGEEGYPGDLSVRCTYTLTAYNTLRIDYHAETTGKTVANLTNHTYFNLEGIEAGKDILDHTMRINADAVTAVDDVLIPTGELPPVAGTPFDFNTPKRIGQDFFATGTPGHAQGKVGGYDHNFVLRDAAESVVVSAPQSGITMTVRTDRPGVQFYTGNFLDGTLRGKGATYHQHCAFCLETQLFPDGINHPNFPSPVVEKGKPVTSRTEYCFKW